MRRLALLLCLFGTAQAADVYFNVINGARQVKVYETANALGINVVNQTNFLLLSKGDKTLKLALKTSDALYNGKKVKLSGPLFVDRANEVYLPLDVLSKYFGLGGATVHDALAEAKALTAPLPTAGKYHLARVTQSFSVSGQEIMDHPTSVGSQAVARLSKTDTVVDTCRKGVLNLLKAPDSAKFPDDTALDVLQDPSGIYIYASEVNALNPMGVMLRNRFTCYSVEGKDFIYSRVDFDN